MYHKLTVDVKSRYQTNLFPSCCFGENITHINITRLIHGRSLFFLHTMHNYVSEMHDMDLTYIQYFVR